MVRQPQQPRRRRLHRPAGCIHGHANSHSYSDSYTYSHSNTDGDGHGYNYSYSNAQTDAHAEICANSEASSHTAAQTVVPLVPND